MSRATVVAAILLAAGCSVKHRPGDPQPSAPAAPIPEKPATAAPAAVPDMPQPIAAAPAAPPPVPDSTTSPPSVATAALSAASPAVPPSPAPAPAEAAPKRSWSLVAITTAIVSPAELIGPTIPLSPEFKRLPVFPEKLTFSVSWGLISVGEATLGVDKIVMFNGRPAYHIFSEARSNSFCDTFYTVRDLNESWLDARTLTSLGYAKKLREGRFFRDEWVLYDRDARTFAARRTNRDGSFQVRVGTIPAQVQDVLSSVSYTRAQDLHMAPQVVIDVNTPDNWPLVVRVTKFEDVKVPAGRFPSVLVEPAMRREGLFIQKGKRLRLWLSDDAAKRPLMMKVEVFFGHITAVLREMI